LSKGGNYLEPYVQNQSNSPIYVKPESSDESIQVDPGMDYYGEVDGLAAPNLNDMKGKVFKLVDYQTALVRFGSIQTGVHSSNPFLPIGLISVIKSGGVKDEIWLNSIATTTITTHIHYTHYATRVEK